MIHKQKDMHEPFVTTNLRLRKSRFQVLKHMALYRGESLAELIRQAIDAFLGYKSDKRKQAKGFKNDPFFKTIDLGEDTITDGSVNHDYYLYGMPKKRKR